MGLLFHIPDRLIDISSPAMIPILLRLQALDRSQDRFRQRCRTLIDLYDGNQIDDLQRQLRRAIESDSEWSGQEEFDNIIEAMISAKAIVFKEQPVFSLNLPGEGGSTEIKTDDPTYGRQAALLAYMVEQGQWWTAFQEIERYTELLLTTLVRWTYRDGYVFPLPLTPDLVEIEQHPDWADIALKVGYQSGRPHSSPWISGPMKRNVGDFHVWSTSSYQRYDHLGNLLRVIGNEGGVNPFGLLPFSTFRAKPPKVGEFFADPGEALLNSNRTFNVKLTEINAAFSKQGFSQAVSIGKPSSQKVETGRTKLIVYSTEDDAAHAPDFKYVSPDSHIQELLTVADAQLKRFSDRHGVQLSASVEHQPESGYALRIRSAPLTDHRMRRLPVWRLGLVRAWPIIRAIANAYADEHPEPTLRGVRFDERLKFNVSIPEPKFEKSPDEEISLHQFDFDNALSSPVRLLMERHGLTEDEAIKRWEENKKYTTPPPPVGGLPGSGKPGDINNPNPFVK